MKQLNRIILFIACAIALAVPSVASAVPYNASTRGFGLRAADINGYTINEWFAATQPTQKSFVRASFDLCHGNPADFNIGGKVNDFAAYGVHILPIITWSDGCNSGNPHIIDTPGEKAQFQAWAHYVAGVIGYVEAVDGLPQTNLYEIWNEPNGNAGGNYGLSDYYNNVYLPGRAGVREVDGDGGTIFGGLCYGSTGGCSYDGNNWMSLVYSRGYTGINGFAVHPYGGGNYTNAAFQTAMSCQIIGNDARSLWVTETGTASGGSGYSEADQKAFLDNLDSVVGPRTWINWIGQDQAATGSPQSMGLIRTDGNGKPSWNYWYGQTFNYAGDTNTHC